MNVFNQSLRVSHCNIIVGKIPKAFDTESAKQIGQLFHIVCGYADYGTYRLIISAKILKIINMPYRNTVNYFA